MISDKRLAVCSALCSMMSVQGGASIAKYLFHLLGPAGAVTLRVGIAGIMLMALVRPKIRSFTREQWKCILIYGLSIGLMNLTFYCGIQRVPLGIGVAIEFIGPLGVAIYTSRKMTDFLWVLLAAAGIICIVPWQGGGDLQGYIFVTVAGIMWAAYILSAGKLSAKMKSSDAVACGMCVATLIVLPFVLVSGDLLKLNGKLLLMGLGVAVFSSALPFTLDLFTIKKLEAKVYSVLQSLHPVFAALSGLIFLKEYLSLLQWLAVLFIVTASAGSALSSEKR
ncbi:MAG: EamA family transporter [Lentisphaeria bacterium]|nr:EamA family transporter [Lentisphaeria bacterium]